MRKDLKIGMAIGAVLLVVLIVYIAVPKNSSTDVAQDDTRDPVQLDTDGADGSGGATPPSAPPQEPATPAEPAGTGVAADDTGSRDSGTDVFSPDATSEQTAAGGAGKPTNWDLLLTTGEMPKTTETPSAVPLRAVTVERSNGGKPAETPGASAEVKTDSDGTPIGTTTAEEKPAESSDATATDDKPAETIAREESDTTTTTTGGARTHKVKANETFSSIAKIAYGSERHYLAIEEANPTIDPRRLRVGTVITLPDLSARAEVASAKVGSESTGSSAAERPSREIDPKTQYKVKSNDSLYKIALAVYGSSNMVDDLYEANKQTIGADSSKLKPGMVLKLPPNPNAKESTR